MSCGIAARGQQWARAEIPVPLPAQALDHGTGYTLAAAVCRALTRLVQRGETSTVRTSLARTARFLVDSGEVSLEGDREIAAQEAEPFLETVESAWGPLARVRCPGLVEGISPGWSIPPGPLGTDAPKW